MMIDADNGGMIPNAKNTRTFKAPEEHVEPNGYSSARTWRPVDLD
jgi:hypothetical protein